jgi:hypothetical protein
MKLSEIKGDRALDVLADIMEPLARILTDEEITKTANGEPKLLFAKKILKGHKKEVIEILAILDGEKPETYEVNLLTLPVKLVEILNDPEIGNLFTLQGQKTE